MSKHKRYETFTGVVHNARGSYWLNVSRPKGPPTHGFRMTRQGLEQLRLQIDRVLAGYLGGGWAYGAQGGRVRLMNVLFDRRKFRG